MANKKILPIPQVLDVLNPFKVKKQRMMNYNPAVPTAMRTPVAESRITVFNYSPKSLEEKTLTSVAETYPYMVSENITWINVDGIKKEEVHAIASCFMIHPLLEEDIISVGQRAKMDEIGEQLFCLLPMMYYNAESSAIEQEQVSIVLGKNYVISFQDDPTRDLFDPIREKLRIASSRIRNGSSDYLCYSLIDIIVDNYFVVLDKLGERIELMEDLVQHYPNTKTMARINFLRREVLLFKRSIVPVRELVNGFMKSESDVLEDRDTKYFKDVFDHIVQCTELAETYREMVLNLQEMYHTQLNLKLNEIMKVLAVVTTLMAPLTLLAGIYGMNFDNMPEIHTKNGYFITLGAMGFMLLFMIWLFRKRGWF
ncbi:magnesium transporter [Chitinophaga jiangningensis]|uniref:Magnesium transport protein CorA n=1 Tax=Chitinophaga jiangningensis TaxID=1419482 RepID=A0A1M7EKM9_9BACT|nr:magnesium/cobalt transporter CorA [Chitinophaga jiangningensis]SHL91949.1 magnesium transporter [Chitinophaga jiangningensis]